MNILRKAPFHITQLVRKSPTGFVSYSQSCGKSDDECANIKEKLVHSLTCEPVPSSNKVTIIGAGLVGSSTALCLLAKQICSELVLIDANQKKLIAEVEDLQHGSLYLSDAVIKAGKDYCCTANSRVCILACGAVTKPGQSRLELTKVNADVMKSVVPKFIETSPNCILIMVTNPVDVLTYVAYKASCFPPNRCFGASTILDSSRFRFYLSERLQIAPSSCHGMIIGEHGDSSVPVWSGVNVAGVRLTELNPCIGKEPDPLKFHEVHQQVVKSATKIKMGKGHTNWGVSMCVAALVDAILKNRNVVIPASIYAKGFYGIKKDVCLSLPCIINGSGANAYIKQKLSNTELKKLQKSAEVMYKAQTASKL